MSLFKYFEKRAKDGLPDPNIPCLLVYPQTTPLASQPRGIWGLTECLLSQQHLKEETWSIQ